MYQLNAATDRRWAVLLTVVINCRSSLVILWTVRNAVTHRSDAPVDHRSIGLTQH